MAELAEDDARLSTARAAAERACACIRAGALRLHDVAVHAEVLIRETIAEAHPDDAVLGEEAGLIGGQGEPSGWRWIVDPLDGTYNFVHGFPHCAVSIAVMHGASIEHAVIAQPFTGEVFMASRGQGARCNDLPLRVGTRSALADALIGIVLPGGQHPAFATVWSRFEAVARASGQVRRTGSAALDLAYVAAGRLDGFFVMSLRAWDIAAGALLVQEAGGVVTDLAGGNRFFATEQCIAGNAMLVPQLVAALKLAQ
jgi:myo-inositol-1(or 4)-monophosphatase